MNHWKSITFISIKKQIKVKVYHRLMNTKGIFTLDHFKTIKLEYLINQFVQYSSSNEITIFKLDFSKRKYLIYAQGNSNKSFFTLKYSNKELLFTLPFYLLTLSHDKHKKLQWFYSTKWNFFYSTEEYFQIIFLSLNQQNKTNVIFTIQIKSIKKCQWYLYFQSVFFFLWSTSENHLLFYLE